MRLPVSRRDEALCEELKELAARLGVRVREEVLLREVGYHVRSGSARVKGEDVIFLDRRLPPPERVEVLVAGLVGRDFDTHYLSPALRRLLEARIVTPPEPSNAVESAAAAESGDTVESGDAPG
jgi:hypothetical protein